MTKETLIRIVKKTCLVGVVTGGLGILILAAYENGNRESRMRSEQIQHISDQVQEGYANPNLVRIEYQDLDGNGKNETLLKYGEKSYLLKLDSTGKPVVQSYEVRPAEVVAEKE
jgi:hypothetical protein